MCLAAIICAGLLGLLSVTVEAGDKKVVATDPDKAGPDWRVQGEYLLDKGGDSKLGAEVIARGDGNFDVNLLEGGLRGQGGDYSKRAQATGKTDGEMTRVTAKDGTWSAVISKGEMNVKNNKGNISTLKKIIRESKTLGQKPPQNAVVLYGGPADALKWSKGVVVAGNLLGSDIGSKETFKDHKIHLEFRLSFMPFASGQGRSNSGVYVQNRYEIQVLDSFGLSGENNECGGLYSVAKPKVNMCYPPLTWQTYDIEFEAARFDATGKRTRDALLSVWHNGVRIHDQLALKKEGPGGQKESPQGGPLYLQGHGGQVQYKNIWVVPLDSAGG
jgi:hypothetical protein